VHIGVVYEAAAAGRAVAIRETDKLSGSFVATAEVAAVRDRMESWSELAFAALSRSGEAPGQVGLGSREERGIPL
jgi:predicted NUDIX family phosphoesterase